MTGKQAIRAVVFLSVFFIILGSLTYVIRTNGEVKDIFTGFYAQENETLDVVMIGSSPVYPFYASPKIWGECGITCYPLASNVQRPSAALPLVKEAYKTQSPKLFVFEMRMYTMEDGTLEENSAYIRGVTDNMKYSFNRIDAINRLVTEPKERYTYYFDIFKYHSNWKTMFLPEQLQCITYEKEHPLMGYEMKDEVGYIAPEDIPVCSDITEKQAIPAEQEVRLRELLAFLKENNQQALFIVSPYRVEEQEMRMFNYMQELVEKEGYTFVNMNQHYEEIGIDFTTDYYDWGSHTNALGSAKCTEYLEKLLKEYNIPDKRGMSGYEPFDEAYELYLEKQEQAVLKIEERINNQDYVMPET